MFGLALALLCLGALALALLLFEIKHYRAGRRLISRRRFALRMAAGVLLLTLLAAVFVGLFVLQLRDAHVRPTLFLGYWFGCILLALALAWVMLGDMREVEDRFSRRQHQLWRDMARFVADQTSRDTTDRVTAEGDDEE